ncbi:hypothetical protein TNCT_599561 [Trichonephila clavata]|uniref:Uncharacterized protein n=1 Tax=Trichonephila clavata TaxID=2740835 RepID=A0A8X6FRH0_TRICU|nr:hypothetical protein TNCT_599561 [Trichonephila clavata]
MFLRLCIRQVQDKRIENILPQTPKVKTYPTRKQRSCIFISRRGGGMKQFVGCVINEGKKCLLTLTGSPLVINELSSMWRQTQFKCRQGSCPDTVQHKPQQFLKDINLHIFLECFKQLVP